MQQQQQQQHKAGSRTATLLLLNVPDSWLAQLLSGQYLDSDSKLSLFQTCKQLNEMVMQNSNSTSLKLDVVARPRNRVLSMLQTANRHATSINLCLRRIVDQRTIQYDGMQLLMMPSGSSILDGAAEQGATKAVKNLKLEVARLETVLPPAIGAACPKLLKLSLYECSIDLDKTISLKQHYPKLRALELDHCECNEVVGGPRQAGPTTCTATQGLTALSSLTIATRSEEFEGKVNMINLLAAPLTHLSFDLTEHGTVDQDLINVNWLQLGATLQYHELPHLSVGDEAMELFLSMPCLKHVLVHYFKLEKSFAGRPCRWEELVIQWNVNAKTLAYLPLHPGLLLKLGCKAGISGIGLDMDTDTCHLLPKAISNVKRANALKWFDGCAALFVYNMDASEFASCFTQALPLIKEVTSLRVSYSGGLNETAMQALCQFASGRREQLNIKFDYNNWLIGDLMTLIAHMPHNSHISFRYEDGDIEQHVIQLCCAAQHRFSLVACRKLTVFGYGRDKQHFCEQCIRSALQANGMEVLSLNQMNGYKLNITVQPHHDTLSKARHWIHHC